VANLRGHFLFVYFLSASLILGIILFPVDFHVKQRAFVEPGFPAAVAAPAAKGHLADLMKTIDWGYVVNQYIKSLMSGLFKPCFCGSFVFGFKQDFWSPQFIQENVASPGYLAILGITVPISFSPMKDTTSEPSKGAGKMTEKDHTRHAHFWKFPLMEIINSGLCGTSSGVSVAYMSELDLTWTSPATASAINPAILLFSNIITAIASISDCVAVTMKGNNKISDKMFFSMGCWGLTFPSSGRSTASAASFDADQLFMAKTVSKAHMLGASFATTVKHAGSICSPTYYPIVPKDEYLYSYIYPAMLIRGAHTKFAFGVEPTIVPSAGMTIPFKEGASLVLLYKHTQCCAF